MKKELTDSTAIIERGNLRPGIYFYTISHDDEVVASGKIVAK